MLSLKLLQFAILRQQMISFVDKHIKKIINLKYYQYILIYIFVQIPPLLYLYISQMEQNILFFANKVSQQSKAPSKHVNSPQISELYSNLTPNNSAEVIQTVRTLSEIYRSKRIANLSEKSSAIFTKLLLIISNSNTPDEVVAFESIVCLINLTYAVDFRQQFEKDTWVGKKRLWRAIKQCKNSINLCYLLQVVRNVILDYCQLNKEVINEGILEITLSLLRQLKTQGNILEFKVIRVITVLCKQTEFIRYNKKIWTQIYKGIEEVAQTLEKKFLKCQYLDKDAVQFTSQLDSQLASEAIFFMSEHSNLKDSLQLRRLCKYVSAYNNKGFQDASSEERIDQVFYCITETREITKLPEELYTIIINDLFLEAVEGQKTMQCLLKYLRKCQQQVCYRIFMEMVNRKLRNLSKGLEYLVYRASSILRSLQSKLYWEVTLSFIYWVFGYIRRADLIFIGQRRQCKSSEEVDILTRLNKFFTEMKGTIRQLRHHSDRNMAKLAIILVNSYQMYSIALH